MLTMVSVERIFERDDCTKSTRTKARRDKNQRREATHQLGLLLYLVVLGVEGRVQPLPLLLQPRAVLGGDVRGGEGEGGRGGGGVRVRQGQLRLHVGRGRGRGHGARGGLLHLGEVRLLLGRDGLAAAPPWERRKKGQVSIEEWQKRNRHRHSRPILKVWAIQKPGNVLFEESSKY